MSEQIKKSKIYTKKGDHGKTSLVDGILVDKFHLRVEAYGSVDELNSFIGMARAEWAQSVSKKLIESLLLEDLFLQKIQNDLFRIGSLVACEDEKVMEHLPRISEEYVLGIERKIDQMDAVLTPLKNFILPGGSKLASLFHICRTVCRRAERRVTELHLSEKSSSKSLSSLIIIVSYMNRLSDYFFVLARYVNHLQDLGDMAWDKDV